MQTCVKCEKKLKQEDFVICDKCSTPLCHNCSTLTYIELLAVQKRQIKLLIYHCVSCVNNPGIKNSSHKTQNTTSLSTSEKCIPTEFNDPSEAVLPQINEIYKAVKELQSKFDPNRHLKNVEDTLKKFTEEMTEVMAVSFDDFSKNVKESNVDLVRFLTKSTSPAPFVQEIRRSVEKQFASELNFLKSKVAELKSEENGPKEISDETKQFYHLSFSSSPNSLQQSELQVSDTPKHSEEEQESAEQEVKENNV